MSQVPALLSFPNRSSFTVALALASTLAIGCSKSPTGDAPGAPSASVAAPSTSVAPPVASASSASAAPAGPAQTTAWSGTYTAKVGPVDPPKAAKEKTWAEDPGSAAVGTGTLELSIVEPRGETRGDAKGALGEMTISGAFDHDELRANLVPKAPKGPDAMTGFMELKTTAPGTMAGTMRVSSRDARIVREASVTLTKR